MQNLKKILPLVEKPGRYIGGEVGSVKKAQSFPSASYSLFRIFMKWGMSHLGSVILYHLTNEREDTYAERAYAPSRICRSRWKKRNSSFSLETYSRQGSLISSASTSPMKCATRHVLRMLELSGIPLRTAERGEQFPLIIAGGTCTYNPEPLADFIDLFIIGEGEQVNMELLDLYAAHKKAGFCKEAFLREAEK